MVPSPSFCALPSCSQFHRMIAATVKHFASVSFDAGYRGLTDYKFNRFSWRRRSLGRGGKNALRKPAR
jgi:hypothetical protein